jgi:fucose 4-O-acetylase-like acetyltransferase
MKDRDYYFDNAKFLLIVFVVFGHFLRPYIAENTFIHSLYVWIFLFHMPAFVLISGYFSKNFHKKGYLKKVTQKILIPYVIFQLLYSVYYSFLYEDDYLSLDFLIPHWGLWFLLSLFCWNVMLYIFAKIPKTYAISLTILMGILIGLTDIEKFLSLSRTFTFFPFFLFGFLLKKKHFERLFQPRVRFLSVILLVSAFAVVHFAFPNLQEEWLYGSKSYETLGVNEEMGVLFRLLLYGVSFLMTLCFMSLIPNRQLTISNLGTRTFYVYILHGFILKYLHATNFPDVIAKINGYPLLIIISIIVTFMLASKPVIQLVKPIIEFRVPLRKHVLHR